MMNGRIGANEAGKCVILARTGIGEEMKFSPFGDIRM
jgi:hypothetical protein